MTHTTFFSIFQDKRKNMGAQGLGFKSKSSKDDSEEQEKECDSPMEIEVRNDLPDFNKMLEEAKNSVSHGNRQDETPDQNKHASN